MSAPSIRRAAREFCAAVMEHAALCEDDPDNAPRIMPVVARIQELARSYGDVVLDRSGWSNPVVGIARAIPTAEQESPTKSQAEESGSKKGRLWISVIDEHALFVDDPDALIAYVEDRTGGGVDGVTEALTTLCKMDGWQPELNLENVVQTDWRSIDACEG
ncbi:hypothetical protein ACFYZ9_38545 [Streptomyces sp. NPDC001691]|uniref:hypothetical protein n=1 Tax=Streptomyces sp. NPDC001691 TaxID=3364600 RepID=UPI0036CA755B